MLELIRRYKALFSVIFVVAAVGMVVSMFGSPGAGPMTGGLSGAEVVATVEGQDIGTRELVTVLNREFDRMESMIQQQSSSAENPEQAKMIRQIMMSQLNAQQILQRIIYQRFIYSTALRMGIRSSPEAVTELIREIPDFQKDGQFDPVLYRQLVARPAIFEEDLRKQVAMSLLQRTFDSGLRLVSKSEVANQQWLDRKITFETVTITPSFIGELQAPTVAELEVFQKEADVEARLQSFYNKNIERFKKDEEVQARHILVKSGSDKDVQKIAQEIREGKITFDEAARKYSDDTSNAAQGGDLGFFGRGMMVPEFEKVAFELKTPNEISEPVKTQFGEHLIQFVARREASSRDLAQVREEILPDVWREKERQLRMENVLKAWLAKPNGPTAADLKPYKLTWEKQTPWTAKESALAAIGNVESQMDVLLRLNKERPFLARALPRGDSQVLLRFVSEEQPKLEGSPAPGAEQVQVAENKVAQAYEHFFRTRYEEAEKKKKIVISEDRVAQIQQSIQAQQL